MGSECDGYGYGNEGEGGAEVEGWMVGWSEAWTLKGERTVGGRQRTVSALVCGCFFVLKYGGWEMLGIFS